MSDIYQDEIHACARGERGKMRQFLARMVYFLFIVLGMLLCLASGMVLGGVK